MSNRSHRLYVGMTDNLPTRVRQHRERTFENAFTARYKFDRLVYFEPRESRNAAERREKQIKSWRREKKIALIESRNPHWYDLTPELLGLLQIE